jgi:hypothetical protein
MRCPLIVYPDVDGENPSVHTLRCRSSPAPPRGR